MTTFVNAAPYDPTMTDDIYKLTDILCLNETEVRALPSEHCAMLFLLMETDSFIKDVLW